MSTTLHTALRLSMSAAARRLGIHTTTIWRWCLHGVGNRKLPSYMFGGRRVVLIDDLEAFLAAGRSDDQSSAVTRSPSADERAADAEEVLRRHGI